MALGSDAHCDNETLTPPRLSGGGAGCEFGGGDRQNCGFGFARSFDGGMKKFREGFDAGDEAGAGPGEMAAGFEGVDTLIADGGNRLPRVGEYHGAVFVARLLVQSFPEPNDRQRKTAGATPGMRRVAAPSLSAPVPRVSRAARRFAGATLPLHDHGEFLRQPTRCL